MIPKSQQKLSESSDNKFSYEVLKGLASEPKSIPSRFLYDEQGSILFEAITRTQEYYHTRLEIEILRTKAKDIASMIPPQTALVEFGSGASRKAGFILEAMDNPAVYIPIDISSDFLGSSVREFSHHHPSICVKPVVANFTEVTSLPNNLPAYQHGLGFFPGSTIGNFTIQEAQNFLRNAGKLLGKEASFILVTDLKKDQKVLLAAYDDSIGVTSSFTLNLLARINRELNANFDIRKFVHRPSYNEKLSRIEVHIVSLIPQRVRVLGEVFDFAELERIHVENSHKYDYPSVQRITEKSGWKIKENWRDPKDMIALWLLTRDDSAFAT